MLNLLILVAVIHLAALTEICLDSSCIKDVCHCVQHRLMKHSKKIAVKRKVIRMRKQSI